MQNLTALFTKSGSNTTETGSPGNSTKTNDYDHVGAMHFIIATILVYSIIGVCCTLVVRIKRSQTPKSHSLHVQDEHIQRYIKEEKYLKQDGFKMKLAFECDRTRERLDEIAGKARLLDIQKSVAGSDFAEIAEKEKKKHNKKHRKSRLESLVGKMGFTLLSLPEVNNLKAEEFEIKQNGHITSSAGSSISETPSHSMISISEVPAFRQNSSSFLPVEQLHLHEDGYFTPSCLSCTSSDDSLQNTLKQVDVPFKELIEINLDNTGFLQNVVTENVKLKNKHTFWV